MFTWEVIWKRSWNYESYIVRGQKVLEKTQLKQWNLDLWSVLGNRFIRFWESTKEIVRFRDDILLCRMKLLIENYARHQIQENDL